ncbi:hypothetical protein [Caballeronia glebae]|jgi:hypothetical protein|uniref:hypothetical protein n=1 Tax=Caballeronia glebae TaxID=1777143 RepID=UPI00117FE9DF|nr:hypothetical protein [Caballeronia glebae]
MAAFLPDLELEMIARYGFDEASGLIVATSAMIPISPNGDIALVCRPVRKRALVLMDTHFHKLCPARYGETWVRSINSAR